LSSAKFKSIRSKFLYTLSFAYFSVVQAYLLVLSFYLVAQALTPENLVFDFDHGFSGLVGGFIGSTGGIVLVALVSTYGIYFLASILYADPWHMITSSWAYFLGMPSSINVLMVYAFCNWHDVSWGTKGSDAPDKLPSAQTKTEEETAFVEELEKPQIDIDEQFAATVKRALTPWQEPSDNEGIALDDSYKAFRTNLVLLWTFSNGLLALCINNSSIDRLCLTVRQILHYNHMFHTDMRN
jgi:chitin synthase